MEKVFKLSIACTLDMAYKSQPIINEIDETANIDIQDRIGNDVFAHKAKLFGWKTEFDGIILEVEFRVKDFKSFWKARIKQIGSCNTVRGWKEHNIHRKSRMPVRFSCLAAELIKESKKTHLIRELELQNFSRMA